MTMFDELRDHDPPAPGARELAAVVARAAEIRRRRSAVRAGGTVAAVLLVIAGVVALRSGGDDGPAVVGPPDVEVTPATLVPDTGAETIPPFNTGNVDTVPVEGTARPPHTDPAGTTGDSTGSGDTIVGPLTYAIVDAGRITELPPLPALTGPAVTVRAGGTHAVVDAGPDGGPCIGLADVPGSIVCEPVGRSAAAVAWSAGGADASSGAVDVVLLVEGSVEVVLDAPAGACSVGPLAAGAGVTVVTCGRVAIEGASLRIEGSRRVVVVVQAAGG